MAIDEVLSTDEKQIFDRKSTLIKPVDQISVAAILLFGRNG